jgi:hypothetical protein
MQDLCIWSADERTGDLRHDTVQCVNLPHERALSDASNTRVAAQLTNSIEPVRKQNRPRASTSSTRSGLATCMTTTDDYHCERRTE